MKYAIVKLNNYQYKFIENKEILVNKFEGKPEMEILLSSIDGKISIGNPVVTKAKIDFEVVEPEVKGKKVVSATFIAKARVRKTKGIRPKYTKIFVKKITA